MPTKSLARTTIDAPASVLALERPPTHPGEVLLEEYLKPAALSQVEAARRMGIPLNRLNEVIRGRRGVSADTALRLATLLDTSAELWLGLQTDWDLWHAAQALRRAG
jgi:antitoxin HigA-1